MSALVIVDVLPVEEACAMDDVAAFNCSESVVSWLCIPDVLIELVIVPDCGCSNCPTEVVATKTLVLPLVLLFDASEVVEEAFPKMEISSSIGEVPGIVGFIESGVGTVVGVIEAGGNGTGVAGVLLEEPLKSPPNACPNPCPSCIPIISCIMLPSDELPPKSEFEPPDDPPDEIAQREGVNDLFPRY